MIRKIYALFILIIFVISGCSIKSADDYYSETAPSGKFDATVSISCDTAVKYNSKKRSKAVVLRNYAVSFNEGDTVFSALKKACKENKIQFEFDGSGDSVYVKGIDYLYEFDCGDLSGWEYSVNGKFPGVGCNAYRLSDGDIISWKYTCNLGNDIGNVYKGDSDE